MKQHYVYCSYEEWGRDYIGVRSCDCLPEEDTKYFGSFRDKTFKPTGKTILFVCETREEAAEIEIKLHDFFDVAVNPRFANKSKQTSTRFDVTGVILGPRTEEEKKKLSKANSGEKNPCYGRTGEKHPQFGVPNKAQSEKMSGEKNPMYGRTGALSPCSKAIIAIKPDGTELHFGSGGEAARKLEINQGNLCNRYLKTGYVTTRGKWKGWQFLFENP